MGVDVAVQRHLGGEAGPAVRQDALEGLVAAVSHHVPLQPGHGAGRFARHLAALPLAHELVPVLLAVHVLDAQVLQQVGGAHHAAARLPQAHDVRLLRRGGGRGGRGGGGGGEGGGGGPRPPRGGPGRGGGVGRGGGGGGRRRRGEAEAGTGCTSVDEAAAGDDVFAAAAAAAAATAVAAAAAAAALERMSVL